MRQVKVICRFIAEDPQAAISDVAIEMDLCVPDHVTDADVADAVEADAHKQVISIGEEFGITFRALDQAEGVFMEVRNG
jgi:hypothetical protein